METIKQFCYENEKKNIYIFETVSFLTFIHNGFDKLVMI